MYDSTFYQTPEQLLEDIKASLKNLHRLLGITELSPRVEAAIRKVPRDQFVDPEQKEQAYEDTPLSIGYGQTISQPSIVAIMTELLNVKSGDRVLEIGTGSGYQAAILAELAKEVYSVEVIPQLAAKAESRLQALGYNNVHLQVGNGGVGWLRYAPYDKIIVTAAAPKMPPALLEQLKPGGRMVLPLGGRYQTQMLTSVDKDLKGNLTSTEYFSVVFVPFV